MGKPHSNEKRSHNLILRAKVKVIATIKNQMPQETKNMPPQKNLSRGSLSDWCDADKDEEVDEDADADISQQYVDPHPTGGRHKYSSHLHKYQYL